MLAHVFQMFGDVAQLGERGVRNAEARGSIPLISTKKKIHFCVLKILANRHFLRFFQLPL